MPSRYIAAVVVGLWLVLSACSDGGSHREAVAELRAAGWSSDAAECFVNAAVDAGGVDAVTPGAELTPERLDALYRATGTCRESDDQVIELARPSGSGLLTERQLEAALVAMTDEELVEWARLFGFEADEAGAAVDVRRDDALRELTVVRGFDLQEARCIIDELERSIGRPGRDPDGAPSVAERRAEAEAVVVCAPLGARD